MLTVHAMNSAGRAVDYYGKDDYYVTGEADAPGLEWRGEGARLLGLQGRAETADFRAVLEGRDPKSPEVRLGQGQVGPDGEARHRPGWDLTFSANKSTSLLILVGGDKVRDEAFIASTEKAMAYAERWFSVTRERTAEGRREKITGNLVYGQTVHGTSREGDPQRHVHYPVANATFDRETGQWRALETRHLYKHQQFLGRLQRAYDIDAAKAQGYDVRVDRRTITWEIEGFTSAQLKAFSKATARVEAALEKYGPTSPAAADAVKLKDRPKKLELPRSELAVKWAAEAKTHGIDIEALISGARERERGTDRSPMIEGDVSLGASRRTAAQLVKGVVDRIRGLRDKGEDPTAVRTIDREARAAVGYGLLLAEHSRAVFTRHQVLDNALQYSRLQVRPDRLETEIARLEAAGVLIKADKQVLAGMTSEYALALERGVIETMEAGRGKARPLMDRAEALNRLSPTGMAGAGSKVLLNDGQRDGALKVLSSPDRYVAIQGFAGAGKTTLFSVAKAAAADKGFEIAALAPSHQAVAALRSEAGLQGRTVSAFLMGAERANHPRALAQQRAYWKGKILLVDEGSMLSNESAAKLVQAAERFQIPKVVFVGDERQLGSPQAGAPFRLLLDEKIDQARLTEIRRQKDPEHRSAVVALARGEVRKGVAELGPRVLELGRQADDRALAKAAADQWGAARAQGGDPAIIVPTNALRGMIGDLVRDELKAAGVVAEQGQMRAQYHAAQIEGPARFVAASYEVGQSLVFHAGNRAAGIRRGEEGQIVGLDMRTQHLVMRRSDGRAVAIDLEKEKRSKRTSFQAYNVHEREVAKGDRLVWERADPDRGFMTGAGFTILSMNAREWRIRHASGIEETLSAKDAALKYTGYGYAETADRSQGQTYREVVAVLSSKHGEAANAARAYVQASRASEGLAFVTDDRALLIQRLASQSGLNPIGLQALKAAPLERLDDGKRDGDRAPADKGDRDRVFVLDVPLPAADKTK